MRGIKIVTILLSLFVTMVLPLWCEAQEGLEGSTSHRGLEVSFATEAVECGLCHQKEFNAWRYAFGTDLDSLGEGSYHALSSTEQMYQGMLGTVSLEMQSYCKGCHESGNAWSVADKVTEIPEPRSMNLNEGINCVICHFDGERLVGRSELKDSLFCATCHNENTGLVDVYEAWLHDYDGNKSCQTCHMPDGNHAFPGLRSPSFRMKAINISAPSFSGSPTSGTPFSIQFNLINDGTGHSLPEDLFRLLNVKVSIVNSENEENYYYSKDFYKRNELFGENPIETEIFHSGEEKTFNCENIVLNSGLYTLKIEIFQETNRIDDSLNTSFRMNSVYKTFLVQ